MELPATLSSAPARSQAPADEEAYTDARQDGQAARRPAAFYSSVFAQVRQPLDEMPAPTEAAGGRVLRFSLHMCGFGDIAFVSSIYLFSLGVPPADRGDRVGAGGERRRG
jgi:E3 ubiquitin-protein ligase FANCL